MPVAPNLRPKVVPHSGSRLLPRLIVRIGGRSVASRPRSRPAPPGSSGPAHGPGGHHPGHPRPVVAALQKREGLLALRLGTPARVLPEPVLPGPVQPQGTSPGARGARSAAVPRRGTLRSFGRLPSLGHEPHPGHREGEGIPQGTLLRAGHLRQERFQDLKWVYGFKVALVVDPDGVVTVFGLGIVTGPTWRTRGSRGSSGSGAGWRSTGLWWPPPRRTTLAGHGRRPIAGGLLASARSSRE